MGKKGNDKKNDGTDKPDGDEIPLPDESQLPDGTQLGTDELKLEGSDAGLLDLDKDADDSVMGGLLNEIMVEEGLGGAPPTKVSFEKARLAKSSLERRIQFHDEIMSGNGFSKVHNYYYTDGIRDIVFSKDRDGKPRVFVMFGYSLKDILLQGKTMREMSASVDEATMESYKFFDKLAKSYFVGGNKKGEGIAPDNKHSRVAFGYSVAYNPNDKGRLKEVIEGIIEDAKQIDEKIKGEIEEKLGEGEGIKRISGEATYRLYNWAYQQYTIKKSPQLEGVEPLGPVIEAATANYDQAEQAKKGRPPLTKKQPMYVRVVSALWPFGKKQDKKPKQ